MQGDCPLLRVSAWVLSPSEPRRSARSKISPENLRLPRQFLRGILPYPSAAPKTNNFEPYLARTGLLINRKPFPPVCFPLSPVVWWEMAFKSDYRDWLDAITGNIHRQQGMVRKFKRQLTTPPAKAALRRLEYSCFICMETKRQMEVSLALLDDDLLDRSTKCSAIPPDYNTDGPASL